MTLPDEVRIELESSNNHDPETYNYYEYEYEDVNEDYDKTKVVKFGNSMMFCNKLLFSLLLIFGIFYLYSCGVIHVQTSKTIIISPSLHSYGSDDSRNSYEYYESSFEDSLYKDLIIKPCIYNNMTIEPQRCHKEYELINVFDICTMNIQSTSYICMSDNIMKNNHNAYMPNCMSVESLNEIYQDIQNKVIRDSVIINPDYYNNNIILSILFSFFPIIIILFATCYIRFSHKNPLYEDTENLCHYSYIHFMIFNFLIILNIILLPAGAIILITSNSIKFLAQIISINCSNVDIFNKLTFIQKVLVAYELATPNYENSSLYITWLSYFTYLIISIIIILVVMYLNALLKIYYLISGQFNNNTSYLMTNFSFENEVRPIGSIND
jgi:hypothetical protein